MIDAAVDVLTGAFVLVACILFLCVFLWGATR